MDWLLVKKIFLDCFKLDQVKYGEAPILTVAHDTDRGYTYEGKHYSPLIDTVEDHLKERGVKCISISRIASRIKGSSSYGNVFSPEGKFARALITKHVKRIFSGKKGYPYSKWEEDIWGLILDRTKAKKVIAIQPSRELCTACHKRKIWVADVQHGVIAENHPWYGAKFRGNDPKEWLPNAFLVWDEGSAAVLRTWSKPHNVQVDIIGNRWLQRFREKKKDSLVNAALRDFDVKAFKAGKPTILVTISWGEKTLPNRILSEEVIQLIRESGLSYSWHLRLHPNVTKGFASEEFQKFQKIYKEQLEPFAKWEEATSNPLPAVLLNTDLHVTWNSSVSIEAAQMGIRSAALDPRMRGDFAGDYYDFYHKKGFIDFIENDQDIIKKWVAKNLENRLQPEDYFEFDNNYENLLAFLSE
jgi:hypothetical protein